MIHKERAGGTVTIREAIKLAVADMLMAGSSAPKMYVRVRPDGGVDIAEENGWACSEDEYYKRVPHTLSLEIPAGVRDYRNLSDGEIEECVDARFEATDQLLEGWDATIDAWLEAGNLAGSIFQSIEDATASKLEASDADQAFAALPSEVTDDGR